MGTSRLLIASVCLGFLTVRPAFADLRARWIGVAGVILEDGETTLLFDPTFTRPGILNWMGLKRFSPDAETVTENLRFLKLKRASAVFVSHEHFDHSVDAAFVAHELGAQVYGGPSLQRVVRANEARFHWHAPFRMTEDRGVVQVGKFRIHFYRRDHAAIFPAIHFRFLPGLVPEDFSFGFYQYREGEVWCYRIEHPEGKLFIDQGSHFFEGAAEEIRGVDYMMAGVANKVSVADFVEKYVGRFNPKILIPLHFDLFFAAANRENTRFMPGVELDEIQSKITREHSKTRFILPKFGETLILK